MSRSGEGVLQMSASPLARWTSSAKTGCSMVVVESLQVLDHHAPSMVLVLESLWMVWPVGTPECDQRQSVTAGGSSFSLHPFLFTFDAAVVAQDSRKLHRGPAGLEHPQTASSGGCVTSCADREEGQPANSFYWQPLEKSPSPVTDNATLKALKLQHPPTEQPPTQLLIILKAWREARAKWQEQLGRWDNAW